MTGESKRTPLGGASGGVSSFTGALGREIHPSLRVSAGAEIGSVEWDVPEAGDGDLSNSKKPITSKNNRDRYQGGHTSHVS